MKKSGNRCEFKEHRDSELLDSFLTVLKTSVNIPLRDMYGLAALRPSSRFWVSEGRAAVVIGAMTRGMMPDNTIPQRREMYEEIYRRVCCMMRENPNLCLTHAVREVIYQAAPQFYLTPKSARTIIYRARRCRRVLKYIIRN